jgi:hypothetical protein
MKALLASAVLLGLSSFTAAHAEWEILEPGTAVLPNYTASAPATSVVAASAPATSVVTAPAPSVAVPTAAEQAGVTTK